MSNVTSINCGFVDFYIEFEPVLLCPGGEKGNLVVAVAVVAVK